MRLLLLRCLAATQAMLPHRSLHVPARLLAPSRQKFPRACFQPSIIQKLDYHGPTFRRHLQLSASNTSVSGAWKLGISGSMDTGNNLRRNIGIRVSPAARKGIGTWDYEAGAKHTTDDPTNRCENLHQQPQDPNFSQTRHGSRWPTAPCRSLQACQVALNNRAGHSPRPEETLPFAYTVFISALGIVAVILLTYSPFPVLAYEYAFDLLEWFAQELKAYKRQETNMKARDEQGSLIWGEMLGRILGVFGMLPLCWDRDADWYPNSILSKITTVVLDVSIYAAVIPLAANVILEIILRS